MGTFFTSDMHFGHENVIKFCDRPYQSADEMNRKMIQNFNEVVQPNDTVYMLGDIFFTKLTQALNIMDQLNGNKVLIYGNHDKVIRKNLELQRKFVDCSDYLEVTETLADGTKQPIVMSHYPFITWNRARHGSWCLHGHSHGSMAYPFKGKILDVGVDVHAYAPISLDEVTRYMNRMPIHLIDHHGA